MQITYAFQRIGGIKLDGLVVLSPVRYMYARKTVWCTKFKDSAQAEAKCHTCIIFSDSHILLMANLAYRTHTCISGTTRSILGIFTSITAILESMHFNLNSALN